MGLSSLLFGGLTLLQNKSNPQLGEDGQPLSVKQVIVQSISDLVQQIVAAIMTLIGKVASMDSETLVTSLLVLSVVFMVAVYTKPSDASFRNYLTDVALHQQLRHIPREMTSGADTEAMDTSDALQQKSLSQGTSPHTRSFSKSISISLRTPPFVRHDYTLFSMMIVSHPPTPCSQIFGKQLPNPVRNDLSCPKCGTADPAIHRSRSSWYIGLFGRWWPGALNVVEGEENGKQPESRWGVMCIKSLASEQSRRSSEKGEASSSPSRTHDDPASHVTQAKAARRKRILPRALRSAVSPRTSNASHKTASDEGPQAGNGEGVDGDDILVTPRDRDEEQAFGAGEAIADRNTTFSDEEVAAVESVIAELQSQLTAMRASTMQTQEQLQTQLEDLRTRKREDDAARNELKSRMKTLDEGKRSAEAYKREAERRLKTAQGRRDISQKRIAQARDTLKTLQDRKSDSAKRLGDGLIQGEKQRKEIADEIEKLKDESQATDHQQTDLQEKLQRLEVQLLQEKENFENVQREAAQRISSRSAHHVTDQQSFAGPEGRNSGTVSDFVPDGGHYNYGPTAGNGYQNATARGMGPVQYLHDTGPPSELEHNLQTFAGRPLSSTFEPFGPQELQSRSDGDLAPSTPRQPRSFVDLASRYTPDAPRGAQFPVSPFSSDLLPSNLFQSADDEALSDVLPGSRAARIEAALGQFGLDNSDQSDIEGGQSDLETLDDAGTSRANEQPTDGSRFGNRGWWASKGRQTSNSFRTLGEPASTSVEGDQQQGADLAKRRPFGLGRLQLGSTGRFRSASRKAANAEDLGNQLSSQHGQASSMQGDRGEWSSDNLESPTPRSGVPFEVVRRAFEASNPPDDEEGRRSWSAFDQWSQRNGLQGPGRGSPASGQGFDAWPEDMFQPLERPNSGNHSVGNTSLGSAADTSMQRPTSSSRDRPNRSRFAFWSQNSKSSLPSSSHGTGEQGNSDGSSIVSGPTAAGNTSVSGGTGGSSSGDAGSSTLSSSAGTNKSRRSFPWVRRQNSAVSTASTSDADADEDEE